jgi:hypothetical protein
MFKIMIIASVFIGEKVYHGEVTSVLPVFSYMWETLNERSVQYDERGLVQIFTIGYYINDFLIKRPH